jgi:sugar phosphate isomerase/epimerase
MKFGITPINVDNFVGSVKDPKGSLNLLRFDYCEIVLDGIKRGYKHIELTLDLKYILPASFKKKVIEGLKFIKEKHKISYSVHFPLWAIEPSCPNRFIRKASTDCLIDTVETVRQLDPDVYVLHASGALSAEFSRMAIPDQYKGIVLGLFADNGVKAIKRLIRETDLDPTKLAIETIEFPLEKTLDQIKRVRGSKMCIDTGHVLAKYPGDIDLVELAKDYLDITGEIHLHDGFNIPNDKGGYQINDHIALGEGNLPVEFLKVLHEKDFQGPVVFELSFDQAKRSLEFIKKNVPEIEIELIG